MKEEDKWSLERYEKLKLRSALGLPLLYPFACREIACILTEVYSKLPKNLQAVILDDAVAAFRLLPQMQMKNAVSAANSLIRSAEAALPKQKRALAVKEFKQGKVANKRRSKVLNFNSGSGMKRLVRIFSGRLITNFISESSKVRWKLRGDLMAQLTGVESKNL